MDLYLIRHPRPAVPAGVCYGRTDLALAEPAGPVAERLAALLPTPCRIYASPLRRARQLAEALGPTTCDARLREVDFGEWEMRPFDELREQMAAWAADPMGFRPPGGETPAEMAARAHALLADLHARHAGEAVAVVAHGGPLRAIAGHLLGLPAERWLALDFECGALSHLEWHDWGVVLRCFNR